MSIEELKPTANLDTIRDGRGGIFTFIPNEPIVEFNFNIIKAGKVRGNHFHTRKIERFAVIRGNALIELRKIGTTKKIKFNLDGNTPSYIDMPLWYTHNIRNNHLVEDGER